MAETLSAILLVTTSARESSIAFRWPKVPKTLPRLTRLKPNDVSLPINLDNPWKASHYPFPPISERQPVDYEGDYYWRRPTTLRDQRNLPFSHTAHSYPTSGRNSPTKDNAFSDPRDALAAEYDRIYDYSSEFLATILTPHSPMCHQKFELIADDLAFIGHPVCADLDGKWRFKLAKSKSVRGRESRGNQSSSQHPSPDRGATPDPPALGQPHDSWLQTFHLVFVLDVPDPSSSASGNVAKYFDIIYEQIAFIVTAVMYQEQVLSNFVEKECEALGSLKDSHISKREPYSVFSTHALERSTLASSMKTLFEAIKSSSMAHININGLPMEIRLPPHLDVLLHSTDDDEIESLQVPDDEGYQIWGSEMSFGWKLPPLAPWKSILLLEDPSLESFPNVKSQDDKMLVEGLYRFLEIASVTLSLADMASLLDWDLESQVYPTVKWLVQHERAKVVDLVHSGLKTVFTLAPKFDKPMSNLTEKFSQRFAQSSIDPLPTILATISASVSKQTDNHFFAAVVKSKELIPIYHDVVLWMLKEELLVTLHLRIRLVATRDLKMRVRKVARERAMAKHNIRGRGMSSGIQQDLDTYNSHKPFNPSGGISWLPLSPKAAHRHFQRQPSKDSVTSRLSELNLRGDEGGYDEGADRESSSDTQEESDGGGNKEGTHMWPSMINDPGRATPLQRKWLTAMSDGKPPHIVKRFNLINQYFDGKKTDDEILYRAEISRKQLREVLHYYEEYLQTFLHPS